MIFFLYGSDNFRSLSKLKEMVLEYQKKNPNGLSLRYFDFENDSFEDFCDQFKIKSIFKEKKLFVIKNAFLNEVFQKKFLEDTKNFAGSGDIFVFYEKEEVLPKDPLFVFLKKKAKIQHFELLTGKKLEEWIIKEFASYNAKADSKTIWLLMDFLGNDLWRLSNEIKKLSSHDKKVTEEDVNLMVKSDIHKNIFKTIDFISAKKKKEALRCLHNHLESGDSPLYLLAMIASQFKKILIVKEKMEKGKSFQSLEWHPFVLRKTSELAHKFSLKELKDAYLLLARLDLDIKSSRIKPDAALDFFVSKL